MLIVIGGQSRKIGKTAVVTGLIAALPEANWTAIKITQHPHGAEILPNTRMLRQSSDLLLLEQSAPDQTDTGRFLAAGARRALWLQAQPGKLARAVPALRGIIADAGNVILESNSILEFIVPDLCLMVLDPSSGDLKESSRRFLDRADALVVVEREGQAAGGAASDRPRFAAAPPVYVSEQLVEFVRAKL